LGSPRVRARRKAYRQSKKEWKVNNSVKETTFAIVLGLGISRTHLAEFDVARFERLKLRAVDMAPELKLRITHGLVIVDENKKIMLLYLPWAMLEG